MDTYHLLVSAGQKTGAAVVHSRCCKIGKGREGKVFAFRVIPGMERMMSIGDDQGCRSRLMFSNPELTQDHILQARML